MTTQFFKIINCPITGAYIPRLLVCASVGFLFIFGFDFIFHHQILSGIYQQTPQLWRTHEEMQGHFYFRLFTEFMTALVTAALYCITYSKNNSDSGITYGLLLGLLLGTLALSSYAWLPISLKLAQAW